MTSDEFADLLPRWNRRTGDPAVLAAIAERIDPVRDAVRQQYDNWFVETAEEHVLPLIGELVGYRPLAGYQRILSEGLRDGGPAGDSRRRLAAALAPRRDVAATVGYRRRKGTLSLLEEIAASVAGWPARAVETSRLQARTLPLRSSGSDRRRLAGLRDGAALDLIGTAFETTARTADLRRPGVTLYVWRLPAHPVTHAPAQCVDNARNLYTFSVLGHDTRLVARPEPEPSPTHLATVDNVPAFLRRRLFADRLADYYGRGKSVAIWLGERPVPLAHIEVADLTEWNFEAQHGRVVVDPELGRIAFGPRSGPGDPVRVSYHYAFGDDLGGGEYPRDLPEPEDAAVYRVGPGQPHRRITEAYRQWQDDRPDEAIIEITDNGVYPEDLRFALGAGQRLTLRAADGVRPVLLADAVEIDGSAMTLDGLLISGGGVHVGGSLTLRHCTLLPDLELDHATGTVHIERSIVGPIRVLGDEVGTDPVSLQVSDSIVDGDLSAGGGGNAHAVLHAHRVTVLGEARVHAVHVVADSIVTGILHVARRQTGVLRFSSVAPGSRTPRRYRCPVARPVFASEEYGTPDYARLAAACPAEIARGAEDGSEMGVFHDLYQPQREDSLRARLAEYTPAGIDAGITFVS